MTPVIHRSVVSIVFVVKPTIFIYNVVSSEIQRVMNHCGTLRSPLRPPLMVISSVCVCVCVTVGDVKHIDFKAKKPSLKRTASLTQMGSVSPGAQAH